MAATALLSGAFIPEAAADPPYYTGEVCVYRDGSLVAKFPPVRFKDCWWTAPRAYDYLRNLSGQWQRAWSGHFCNGASQWVGPGTGAPINLWWSVGG